MLLKGLDECFKLSSWVRGGAPKALHFSAVFGIKSNTFYSYLHDSGGSKCPPCGGLGQIQAVSLSPTDINLQELFNHFEIVGLMDRQPVVRNFMGFLVGL